MSKFRVWIAFIALSIMWGSSYLFIRVGVRQLSPASLVAARLLIGATAILAISLATRQNLRLTRSQLLALIAVGTLNTSLPFLLITWSEVTVPSGLASVLNSTVPIFSVVLAALVLHDEPITLPRAGGVALGFGGVVLLASRDLSHGGINWSQILAQGAVVLAALLFAISAVLTRRTLREVHWMTIATYALCVAAIETLALALIRWQPASGSMKPITVIAIVWLGLLGSGIAYLLYFFVIQNWGAARSTMVTYVIPVVGLTLGAIFLGETVDWRILAGSALVILGIVLASFVKRARRAPKPETQIEPERAAAGVVET